MVRVCESNIFPCVRRPSICPSRYLLLSHRAEFNQTCYITSPHGKGVREQHNFLCVRSSVRASVVRPSVCHPILLHLLMVRVARATFFRASVVRPSVRHAISSYTTGWNFTKFAAPLPLMVRVCESSITFPCVRRPSICSSRFRLLNHWAEFNETYYITFSHCKGVREQHYFSVRLSSVCPSARHAISS